MAAIFIDTDQDAAEIPTVFAGLESALTSAGAPFLVWVEKVEKRAGQRLDPSVGQCFADCILVIDHESKMAALVGRLSTALLQGEELVAQIDEGRSGALAPKFELEQSTVESQSLFDITDFERYVVETDGARFSCFIHGALLWLS